MRCKATEKINTVSYPASVQYDAVGRVIIKTYPDNFELRYFYDGQGKLIEIHKKIDNSLIWKLTDVDFYGRADRYQLGIAPIIQQNTYRTDGTLNEMYTYTGNHSSSPNIRDIAYKINPQNGDVETKSDYLAYNNGNYTTSKEFYHYDNVDRLDQKPLAVPPLPVQALPLHPLPLPTIPKATLPTKAMWVNIFITTSIILMP